MGDRYYAGGGQGGDVLNQIDNYIEGRPISKNGMSGPKGKDGHSTQPGFFQDLFHAARDEIFGKPKQDDIRTMDTGPSVATMGKPNSVTSASQVATDEIDTAVPQVDVSPGGKAKSGLDSIIGGDDKGGFLKTAMSILGAIF